MDIEKVLIMKDGQGSSYARVLPLDHFDQGVEIYNGPNTEYVGKDERKHANIAANVHGMVSALKRYEDVRDIVVSAGTVRGATFDMVDEHEMPGPYDAQTNVHEMGREVYEAVDAMMPPEKRFVEYGLPNIAGSLEPFRSIAGWAIEQPELLKQARRIRGLDQLFIGPMVGDYQGMPDEPGISAGYAGCHGGLKRMRGFSEELLEFSELAWMLHDLVRERTGRTLIGDLIPQRIYTPTEYVHFSPDKTITDYTGLRTDTNMLPLDHDTTSEVDPIRALADLEFSPEQTVVVEILGSWYMFRVASGCDSTAEPFEMSVFGKGFMGQGDLYGRFVPTTLTASGEEFDHVKVYLKAKGLEPPEIDEMYFDAVAKVIRDGKMFAIQGWGDRAKFASQFPGSVARYIDPDNEMLSDPKTAYAVANLMTAYPMTWIAPRLGVGDDVPHIISGGSAGRGGIVEILASSVPNPVYVIVDSKGNIVRDVGLLSSWMRARGHVDRCAPEEVDISGTGMRLQLVEKRFDSSETRAYMEQAWDHATVH